MKRRYLAAAAAALAGTVAAARARRSYQAAMAEAQAAWQRIAARARPDVPLFDPAIVSSLPEIAQRYFRHAIAPDTPLHRRVELEMTGTFLLGSKDRPQRYRMAARQILAPGEGFVWLPRMRNGPVRISGSDGMVDGQAWTRFWLQGLIPVADQRTTPDLLRSAAFRSVAEGVWAPASLLPMAGAQWEQVGHDQARVTFTRAAPPVTLQLSLTPDGAIRELVGQRWSNANPQKVFRLQPFGGTVLAHRRFGGFTIPSQVALGNLYGTPDYLPFFQAEIVSARYF